MRVFNVGRKTVLRVASGAPYFDLKNCLPVRTFVARCRKTMHEDDSYVVVKNTGRRVVCAMARVVRIRKRGTEYRVWLADQTDAYLL